MTWDLAVIPCGARKQARPAPAACLYTGPYFTACRRAALALNPRHGYLILSGKYGLLRPDTRIEPYEMRLGQPGSVTAAQVIRQARDLGVTAPGTVAVFGGRDYIRLARAVWPQAQALAAGSLGQQMRQLAAIAQAARQDRNT